MRLATLRVREATLAARLDGGEYVLLPQSDLGQLLASGPGWQDLAARLDGLAVKHSGIADDALGHGLSFRDPDGIALEFWAPRS